MKFTYNNKNYELGIIEDMGIVVIFEIKQEDDYESRKVINWFYDDGSDYEETAIYFIDHRD